ncbi:MAG: fatty acyl-AMP ligase [Gammaproteobacteria bacterium]|nr:fatty acyl-AMP ligase [Gammaproteobacteria bacterium]
MTTAHLTTLVDLAMHRAAEQSASTAFTQLNPGGEIERHITFAHLDLAARNLAGYLQNRLPPRSRVLLAYPNGIDFIIGFFACLYAGMIAVPVYPPFARSQWPRFAAIASDCQAAMICTLHKHSAAISNVCVQTHALSDVPCIASDGLNSRYHESWKYPDIKADSLAFLQYTSGTTGDPKGVMVSHENIMVNQAMITQAFNHSHESKILGWLPMFHDMGLIGNVLNPFYVGVESILMEPLSFLRQPYRWLKAISDFKATTSGAPNFAYDLCVSKISSEHKQGLDLRHWQNAFNGSEKVHYQTLEKFSEYFADCGFQKNAFLPCYGMAEATLFVTGKQSQSPVITANVDKNALQYNQVVPSNTVKTRQCTLTGCGGVSGPDIRLMNPDTLEACGSDEIGEIWITGKHITQGYWNKSQLTADAFKQDEHSGNKHRYFRTGDLGVIIRGQLYITGRIKELIIVRGKNYYPQDIELVAQNSNPACRLGRGAAFSVESDTQEMVVLVQEIEKTQLRKFDDQGTKCDIQLALRAQLNLEVDDIVFVKPASIPLTSSGKTQRQRVKELYLQRAIPGVIRSMLAA